MEPGNDTKLFSRKLLYLKRIQNEISISTLRMFYKILQKSKSNSLKVKCLWVLGHLFFEFPIRQLMENIEASTDLHQANTEEESFKRAVGTICRNISKTILKIIKDNKNL